MELARKDSNYKNIEIKSLEDYENIFKYEWPAIPDDIEMPNYNIDEAFGSIDNISKMLEGEIMKKNTMFKNLENRIENMDHYVNLYKSDIFTDEKRISKIKLNRFYAPDRYEDEDDEESFFITENDLIKNPVEGGKTLPSAHRRRKRLLDDKQKKRLENVLYIGFSQNELSDLPGFLEPPQILNVVTASMGFTPSFMRFWTPIIRSEASNAILLDSFWWFYLQYFKKDPSLDQDKLFYFSRVADSFVALFLSVDPTMRDKFFNIYPNFLSQAIYLTFYRAFADSRLQFNDEFKQEICDIVNEWVLGVKPIPESYKDWKITIDSNVSLANADGKIVSTVELMQKIGNLEKMLKTLGNEDDNSSKPNTAANKSVIFKKSERIRYRDNADEILTSFYDKKLKQSHAVGGGAVMEKVLFNLKGQSVLISHYLNMHNLQESEPQGHKVKRTQIAQQPSSSAPTYKDVVYQSLERTKTLESEFAKISKQTEDEIKKIEKERRKLVLEHEKSLASFSSKKLGKELSSSSNEFKDESKTSKQYTIQSDENKVNKDLDEVIDNFQDIPFDDE